MRAVTAVPREQPSHGRRLVCLGQRVELVPVPPQELLEVGPAMRAEEKGNAHSHDHRSEAPGLVPEQGVQLRRHRLGVEQPLPSPFLLLSERARLDVEATALAVSDGDYSRRLLADVGDQAPCYGAHTDVTKTSAA
jgi:hypothetical protein